MNQTNTVSAPRTKTYEITMTALMAAVTCILALNSWEEMRSIPSFFSSPKYLKYLGSLLITA